MQVYTTAVATLLLIASTSTAQEKTNRTYFSVSGGGKLFYEVRGEGKPVVFLHDGLLHSASWSAQWEFLGKHYKVIRYDRRGFGKSDKATEPYSEVQDLYALFEHLNLSNTMIIACSAGGALALDFALAYPPMVERMILVGPIVSGLGFSTHFQERNRAAFAPLKNGDVAGTISNWVNDPWLIASGSQHAKERFRELLTANPQNLTHSGRLAAGAKPAIGQLHEVSFPVLIVVGEHDIPDVHAHCGAIQAGIAHARRTIIRNAGHLVFLEKPDEFNKIVAEFLSVQTP